MKFHYLRQGGPTSTPIPGVDDGEDFRSTQHALSIVGISVEKQWAVFKLLAALLHLGNVKITQMRTDASIEDNDTAMLLCTRFLGITAADFKNGRLRSRSQLEQKRLSQL